METQGIVLDVLSSVLSMYDKYMILQNPSHPMRRSGVFHPDERIYTTPDITLCVKTRM